jgi:hypothetical protein
MTENKTNVEPVEPVQIPHQAIISLSAVVNQQMSDGTWHPRSTFSDQFFLRLVGQNEKEVVQNLKAQLKELQELWAQNGGQIGRLTELTNDSRMPTEPGLEKTLKGLSSMTEATQLLSAQLVDDPYATSGSNDQPSKSPATSSQTADTAETEPSK